MTVKERVSHTIAKYSLLDSSGRKVIVGLSGGADSIALLHILSALDYKCVAANCNFHLREEESDRDTDFAKSFAEKSNVEFVTKDFDVASYRRQNPSMSVEDACRRLRYQWFEQLKDDLDAQAIAVGHHSDDAIETFLFNMQRGTGLRGLRGISPKNDRGVIRPLIETTKEEILSYCRDNSLKYVIDSSNLSNEFSRNKLRNIVIPCFEHEFPNLRKGMLLTINNISEATILYYDMLDEKRAFYSVNEHCIRLKELIDSETNPSLYLYEWFKSLGLTRNQADTIVNCYLTTGSRFPTPQAIFSIDRGNLIISPLNQECEFRMSDLLFEVLPISEFRPPTDRLTACFNISLIQGDELKVRKWSIGDRIHPFGMKGTKKVSDIFSDAKITLADKERIPLLVKGDNILWIIGLRQSDKLKIKPTDREFVRVTYVGPHIF